jgi:hypothetical protein
MSNPLREANYSDNITHAAAYGDYAFYAVLGKYAAWELNHDYGLNKP